MRVALALFIVLFACGRNTEDCRFDIQCSIGRRCAMGRCVPVQAPQDDASVDGSIDAVDAARDADADSGLDAGPDVSFACELESVAGPTTVGHAYSLDEVPQIVRAGPSYALLYRGLPDDGPTASLSVALLDDEGSVLESGPLGGSAPQRDLALAAGRDGSTEVLAAWAEIDESIHAVRLFDAGNEEPAIPAAVTEPSDGSDFPALASSADGFVLAWSDRATGLLRVLTRLLDSDGVPTGEPSVLDVAGSATRPVLASTADSSVPMAWRDSRELPSRLWMGLRELDGNVTGHLQVSELPLGQSAAAVQTDWGTFLSWIEVAPIGAVYVSHVQGGASESSLIGSSAALDPRTSLAYDGRGLLAAWHEGSGKTARAWVTVVRVDLSLPSEAPLELPAPALLPRVVASSAGSGVVVWVDAVSADIEFVAFRCAR